MAGSGGNWSRKSIQELEEKAKKEISEAAKYREIAGEKRFDERALIEESCDDSQGNTWTIYRSMTGEWGWRCSAGDGKGPNLSETGYKSRNECIDAARQKGMDCDPSREII